jgi:hypothetical protein
MEQKRADVIENIEIAIVELRDCAQPRDVAELRALVLDAKEAESEKVLEEIVVHVENLRAFCEARKKSGGVARAR